jgi:aryl-alcohol dehydrogenase-like predicted oxidoreductase
MKYLQLGSSNLKISRLSLGTWAIGGSMWGQYDEQQAVEALETAIDHGVNLIDTAPVYGNGHAEELLGKVIKNKRDKVIIATKCGLDMNNFYKEDLSPKFLEQELENSLRRLQTDYIDLYQCHWPDKNTPIEITMAKLKEFQQAGKIREIGVSNFNASELVEAKTYAEIVSDQPQYSLLERTIETDGVQASCVDNNIAIIPYGSLGAGFLTGKYKDWPKFGKSDCRTFFYKFCQEKYWPRIQALVAELKKLAKEKNTTPGNIALAWLLAQPGVASVIVGAKNPAQLLENIDCTKLALTAAETTGLTKLTDNFYA